MAGTTSRPSGATWGTARRSLARACPFFPGRAPPRTKSSPDRGDAITGARTQKFAGDTSPDLTSSAPSRARRASPGITAGCDRIAPEVAGTPRPQAQSSLRPSPGRDGPPFRVPAPLVRRAVTSAFAHCGLEGAPSSSSSIATTSPVEGVDICAARVPRLVRLRPCPALALAARRRGFSLLQASTTRALAAPRRVTAARRGETVRARITSSFDHDSRSSAPCR